MQALSDFITLMTDRRVSLVSKLLFFGLIGIYIVLPIDLIPDFLLPLGLVDDGGMVLAAMVAFTRHARKQVEADSPIVASDSDAIIMPPAEPASPTEARKPVVMAESARPATAPPVLIQQSSRGGGTNCGCLALIALLFLSPFIGFAILTLTGGLALTGLIAPIVDFFDPPASVNFVSSRTIVNSLQGLGQLVTVRSEFAKPDLQVTINEGILNSGFHSANHEAFGSIEAGVDITQFSRDDVRYDGTDGSIHLTLPPPMITSCNVEYIDQEEYSISVFQKDWDAVRQLAEYEAIMQFREDALEGDILEEAEEEIRQRLGTFLNALTGAPVHIDFKEAGELEFGDTCQPLIPDGWGIDAETGEWVRAG